MGQAKKRGTYEERVQQAKKKNLTAKELFGENTRYKDTTNPFRVVGERQSWDASGGKGPMAVFTVTHEVKKLINTIETEPVQYHTKLIKSDWDAIENKMRQTHTAKNLSPEYLVGFFMAIVPTKSIEIANGITGKGMVGPNPPKGTDDYDWSDQVQKAKDKYQMTVLNDNFVMLAAYCSPDMVWDHCKRVFKYFNYAAVAFSNPLNFEILAEDCQWQAVWNGKLKFSDVSKLVYGPDVLKAMATHNTKH